MHLRRVAGAPAVQIGLPERNISSSGGIGRLGESEEPRSGPARARDLPGNARQRSIESPLKLETILGDDHRMGSSMPLSDEARPGFDPRFCWNCDPPIALELGGEGRQTPRKAAASQSRRRPVRERGRPNLRSAAFSTLLGSWCLWSSPRAPGSRRRHAINGRRLSVPANEMHVVATLTQAGERSARRMRQPACGAGQFCERCALVGRRNPEHTIELRAGPGRTPRWFACTDAVLIRSTFVSRVLNRRRSVGTST